MASARSSHSTSFVVYDDILAPELLAGMQRHLQDEPFEEVHASGGYRRTWSVVDGRPLRGPLILRPDPRPKAAELPQSPVNPGVDRLLDVVEALAARHESLVGRVGDDWEGIAARSWLYPPGSGLGWHDDHLSYTGAFVFFAHPRWLLDWGGELMLLDEAAPKGTLAEGVHPSALLAPRLLPLGPGGSFVTASTNRLVFLRSGVTHRVAPVSGLAGHELRTTISGFFLRRARG